MFEKSLYDLIRGLRNHKGNEREYIQESIRECRREIRSQDMDLKATALLKLTYLEMFGHDMSWASFHVLEVISSQKFLHKRVGYLAAIQSFRSDTEVLMLAENQLKKDLSSPHLTTIALPLIAVPHVINPGMANSLLTDILPRLTHSSPLIRKKTVVTLYRLALVYPETLRPAWPRIKERLSDKNEHPSVTAAIVNVICELSWRRPQDFLPLAPRLFDLLVQDGNNWMRIKLIKLFATLTPLEPRLIKKLLAPLTDIIRSTPAMSLMYECIHGIVEGGILQAVDGTTEGEEVVRLCVGKLRIMLSAEGDANLKYVALLAFEKLAKSHSHLVSLHAGAILECIDDADVSIRMRALDMVVDLVDAETLRPIVQRLMRQLRDAQVETAVDDLSNDRGLHQGVVPQADSDDSEVEETLRPVEVQSNQNPPLPDEYRSNVIQRILEMCARDTYSNISDFEWYINILVQLVRYCPSTLESPTDDSMGKDDRTTFSTDVSLTIGAELRNVAVRVKSVRSEVTAAAQSLILFDQREKFFPPSGNGGRGVLGPCAWIVGEFAVHLTKPDGVMTSLLHNPTSQHHSNTLATYIQAVPKVFAYLTGNDQIAWSSERKTMVSLLLTRINHFLEPLASHPDLEIQERAVEYLELTKLAMEALTTPDTADSSASPNHPPLFLTQAIPALFVGMELNPVAPGAQRKVPVPEELDLEAPINESLQTLLRQADYDDNIDANDGDDVSRAYYEKPTTRVDPAPVVAADRSESQKSEYLSYQRNAEDELLGPDAIVKRKAERRERHKDDPFYIAEGGSGTSTPVGNVFRASNGEEVDLDAIPVMDLKLDEFGGTPPDTRSSGSKQKRRPPKHFEILVDENLDGDDALSEASRPELVKPKSAKRALLQLDSAGLASLSLEDDGGRVTQLDIERREAEEAEMARAIKEVERKRLEMQREAERIEAANAPHESAVVKRKKKKARNVGLDMPAAAAESVEAPDETVVKKKKKKKPKADVAEIGDGGAIEGEAVAVKTTKKKQREVVLD